MERLLLREFVHRMNNEFASAISAIAAAERRCDSVDAKAAMASVRNRLIGHANVQQFLRMPDYTTTIDLAAYLHQLCRAISESKLAGEGIGLSLALFPLKMRSDRCWLLGMIVFELITNAARHAFRNKANREIRLTVILADRSIACSITDNGECDGGSSPGRGIAIVEALAATLKGTVDMQFGRSGSTITVNVPVAE
ncbi:histidine kinase dimerization/phosphoacceptor domain -containing protein [Bradyrhizobium sp. STM 3557]|uniref:histidine kinase dimerization/phosphoacceptor domain -containing protein n=1 Tax=Bradyrhizobium sp. STM 3557 TaxID=578920 RepID=UPI00389057A4